MLTKLSVALIGILSYFVCRRSKSTFSPSLEVHRREVKDVAVVFIHGFSGNVATWTSFIDLLMAEKAINSWDLFSLSYPTGLRIDIPNLWSADPEISTLSAGLVTTLSASPLNQYKRIALIAHSMGGLIVQQAIVEDNDLAPRLSHVIFFGTPSAGLNKATLGKLLKRQFRDMASESVFISKLRARWNSKFGDGLSFQFMVLQGDRDEFVSGPSSLSPFAKEFHRVVPGNHSEIVRPQDRNNLGFQLVLQQLSGTGKRMAMVDGARLAVELGEFQDAVNSLLPCVNEIDEAAMVTLALALDGLSRSAEALELLEKYCKKTSADARGVLAGRIKRRWLTQRSALDLSRAKNLYESGLNLALQDQDYNQAYYHAINLAFLDLISAAANSLIPESVLTMAHRALDYCARADESRWCWATKGEAYLMIKDQKKAESCYRKALDGTSSPRERQSMYSQAIRVALCTGGEESGRAIEEIFGVREAETEKSK